MVNKSVTVCQPPAGCWTQNNSCVCISWHTDAKKKKEWIIMKELWMSALIDISHISGFIVIITVFLSSNIKYLSKVCCFYIKHYVKLFLLWICFLDPWKTQLHLFYCSLFLWAPKCSKTWKRLEKKA